MFGIVKNKDKYFKMKATYGDDCPSETMIPK